MIGPESSGTTITRDLLRAGGCRLLDDEPVAFEIPAVTICILVAPVGIGRAVMSVWYFATYQYRM
jgi:hypothetical protein